MKTIQAIIERAADGTYDVYCKNEIFSGAGASIEEAKEDMRRQMTFYKETASAEGFKYPAFLDEDFTMCYTLNITSLVKYYVSSGIFTLAGLEKITGINQKQLWTYLNGSRPRKAQEERLEAGLRKLTADLNTFFM